MGRPQRHIVKCIECGKSFPHNLTICIRLKNGHKMHRCLACDERIRATAAAEWRGRHDGG